MTFCSRLIKIQIALAALVMIQSGLSEARPKPQKKVVIGYVEGFRGLINTSTLDIDKVTHINYAFIDVRNNRAWFNKERTDTVNLRSLVALKIKKPDLKILISIGGWTWSGNFSDAVLTDSSRRAFAASAVDIVAKYHLDGIDIDWEYPALKGAGNINRPEDKQNYTLMFKAIRHDLDSLQKITSQTYLLSTAVGGFANYIKNTEMAQVASYTDYINLMTYDYTGANVTRHHTNLYPSFNYVKENSADKAVNEFIAAGVPPSKLVMGIAFYGRGWLIDSVGDSHGFNQKSLSSIRSGGYTFIKDSLVNKKGFKSYWDKRAKVPFLLNSSTRQWISYDNERSVKQKCKYVQKHQLAGVMFWSYDEDSKEYLLNTINRYIH